MSKLDQSFIMAKYNRRKNRHAGLSSNPPSLSISLLFRSTLVQRREESSHLQTLAFARSMNNEQGFRGAFSRARGPAYIAPSNERGPSDQTDLNRMVFLDPQRRSLIGGKRRVGALGGRAGALPPGPLGLLFVPVASGLFQVIENCAHINISM